MANYQYQNFSYSYFLMILFIQVSIFALAQPSQYDTSNSRSIQTITSTISYDNHDENFYANDNENSAADMYDDEEEDSSGHYSSATSNSQNMTSHLNKEVPVNAYDDEMNSYQDEEIESDTEELSMYGDTRSVDRPGFIRPNTDSDSKKSPDSLTTSRLPSTPVNFWNDLFSKPVILVGIAGGIIIGMLSAILLVMFIIYRMRKKDEGSYVLEEAPRKSPSHAYTKVSSREFFA